MRTPSLLAVLVLGACAVLAVLSPGTSAAWARDDGRTEETYEVTDLVSLVPSLEADLRRLVPHAAVSLPAVPPQALLRAAPEPRLVLTVVGTPSEHAAVRIHLARLRVREAGSLRRRAGIDQLDVLLDQVLLDREGGEGKVSRERLAGARAMEADLRRNLWRVEPEARRGAWEEQLKALDAAAARIWLLGYVVDVEPGYDVPTELYARVAALRAAWRELEESVRALGRDVAHGPPRGFPRFPMFDPPSACPQGVGLIPLAIDAVSWALATGELEGARAQLQRATEELLAAKLEFEACLWQTTPREPPQAGGPSTVDRDGHLRVAIEHLRAAGEDHLARLVGRRLEGARTQDDRSSDPDHRALEEARGAQEAARAALEAFERTLREIREALGGN